MSRRVIPAALISVFAGCADVERFDRPLVSDGLQERAGLRLGPAEGGLPPGVVLEDGLTEEEAVAFALWNNAALHEALAELGLRRADILVAGQIPNPVLSVLFPLSPKQLEFTAKLPLEFLWLRPARVAAAEFDAERVTALLVQGGLDLVRNVRTAYADLALAEARLRMGDRLVALGNEGLRLAEAKLRAGEASEGEAVLARTESILAGLERDRAARDLASLRPRMEALLGLGQDPPRRFLSGASLPTPSSPENEFLSMAIRSRPDLQAARLAIEGAAERADLAGIEFLALTAVLDANQPKGPDPLEAGPGVDAPIPLFNWNQGGRARAAAELERAARHYESVRTQIALEVRASLSGLARARESRDVLEKRAGPAMEEAVTFARRAFEAGETSRAPILALEARAAQLDFRRAEAEAEFRRARAELERSVGRRLP